MEHSSQIPQAPIFEVNVSEAWDTQSQLELFLSKLRELPFYRPGLLYSGFDADDIGKRSDGKTYKGVIFCASEESLQELDDGSGGMDNPFMYASRHNRSAIAIYDKTKLKQATMDDLGNKGDDTPFSQAYVASPGANIATVRIVFHQSKNK